MGGGARLVVLGHSEGGTLAPIVAERSGAVAGVAVVNSVLFPVDELLIAQLSANPTVASRAASDVRRALAAIKDGTFPRDILLFGAGARYWKQWIELSGGAPATLSALPMALLLVQSLEDETLPGDTLTRNLDILRAVAATNPRAALRELPAHDHFTRRSGQAEPSPEFLESLIAWLRRAISTGQRPSAARSAPSSVGWRNR